MRKEECEITVQTSHAILITGKKDHEKLKSA